MANASKSASKSTTLTANTGAPYTNATLTASFNETATSTANNTSTITVTATQKIGNADWSSSYTSTLQIWWYDNNANGGGKLVASTGVKSQGRNATITASGTITVGHKSDGSLSGYAKAVWTKAGNSNWTPNSGSVSTNNTDLTSIPRAATISKATNFNDTANPTITYSNPAGNAVTSLRACISLTGATDDISYRDISKTGTSYTFNLTEAERNVLRNAAKNSKTLTVRFYVATVLGGNTYRNYTTATMTIVNANPTFSAAYLDTNATTTAITSNNQQIIRNQSQLKFNITNLSAKKYATISSVKAVLGNGTTYTGTISGTSCTINAGRVNLSSNTTATITVTDSRGNSTNQNLTLQVLDWSLPTAIITAERQNHFYTPTTLTVDGNCSSLDGKNEMTIRYRYEPLSTTYSSNLFDYSAVPSQLPQDYFNAAVNSDGSLTVYGHFENTIGPAYQVVYGDEITSTLEDGETYILSQTSANENFYVSVSASNTTTGTYETYSCETNKSVTFTVDKTTYNEYYIQIVLFPTSYQPYEEISLTENFSLVQESTSAWSGWQTISDNVPTVVNLDNEYAWEVQVRVADKIGATTYNITVPRGMPIMFIDRLLSSVGFNCFPKYENSVEVNGTLIERSIMTRTLEAQVTNLHTNTYTIVPLTSQNSIGSQLTSVANGGIRIGAGVSKILVSAKMAVEGVTVAGSRHLRICKNAYSAANTLGWDWDTLQVSDAESLVIEPQLVDVEEGDVIYMYYWTQQSSDKIGGNAYGGRTSLTVEVVG